MAAPASETMVCLCPGNFPFSYAFRFPIQTATSMQVPDKQLENRSTNGVWEVSPGAFLTDGINNTDSHLISLAISSCVFFFFFRHTKNCRMHTVIKPIPMRHPTTAPAITAALLSAENQNRVYRGRQARVRAIQILRKLGFSHLSWNMIEGDVVEKAHWLGCGGSPWHRNPPPPPPLSDPTFLCCWIRNLQQSSPCC